MKRYVVRTAVRVAVAGLAVASVAVGAAPAHAADPVTAISTSGSQITVTYDDEAAQGLSNQWGSRPRDVAWILQYANREMRSPTCQYSQPGGAFYEMAQVTATSFGFCWNADDSATSWYPQGVTTTHDALNANVYDGVEAVAVTWHNSDDSSTRLSLAPGRGYGYGNNKYRHILLVKPAGLNSPDFHKVACHAGGAMWYGRLLYVACTTHIKIFSWDYVHSADHSDFCADKVGHYRDGTGTERNCADDYAYAMFQVGTISSSTVRFSTLSLDRAATPDKLVVGTYTEGNGGKVYRYDLDYTTRLPSRSTAANAFSTSFDRIQGVTTRNNKMWFHSTGGENPRLRFWDHGTKRFQNRAGAYGAQALSYWADPNGPDMLYTLSEHPSKRAVLAVEQSYFD